MAFYKDTLAVLAPYAILGGIGYLLYKRYTPTLTSGVESATEKAYRAVTGDYGQAEKAYITNAEQKRRSAANLAKKRAAKLAKTKLSLGLAI